ncbi:Uncharacterised protein [Achromobacter sp. 2789STDY5608633]|nr:Uncharacterised protein [Achromobacter sp. 2789STDY5608633]
MIQRPLQQRFVQRAPEDERRLHALFVGVALADGGAVFARVQLRQAGGEQRLAPRVEIGRVQVGRPALERMEKRARQRREYGRPAQQAEQRIDQRVLDVMDRCVVAVQVIARGELDRRRRRGPLERQVETRDRGGRAARRALPQLAAQARQHARQALGFFLAFGPGLGLQGQRQRRVEARHAFVHADAAMTRAGVGAERVHPLRGLPILGPLAGLAQAQQHLGAALFEPGIAAGAVGHRLQQRIDIRAVVQRLAAGVQGQVAVDVCPRLEGPRGRLEWHRLVLEHAQVGKDEL